MSGKEHTHHILPLGVYLKIGATLLILTVITVWVAQYNLGEANLLVAMLIAGIKASLVALFFMHLKYDNKLFAAVFVGALLFLAAFIVFTMFDTMARGEIDEEKAMPFNNQVEYRTPAGHGESHGEAAVDSAMHGDSTAHDSTESPDTSAAPAEDNH